MILWDVPSTTSYSFDWHKSSCGPLHFRQSFNCDGSRYGPLFASPDWVLIEVVKNSRRVSAGLINPRLNFNSFLSPLCRDKLFISVTRLLSLRWSEWCHHVFVAFCTTTAASQQTQLITVSLYVRIGCICPKANYPHLNKSIMTLQNVS